MRKERSKLISNHKSTLAACAAVLLLYLFLFAVGISCPIKFFTGISCPGCGMTRACIHALCLDFDAAFAYHPLWIMLPFVVFFLILFKIQKKRTALYALLYASAAALLAVYLYRLFFTDSEVVVCSIESGFFARCLQSLLALFDPK